jgi:hypothetical protein
MTFPKGYAIGLMVSPAAGTDTAPPGFPVNAVHFDGTNDHLNRGAGLTGGSDGNSILISLWFNFTGGDGVAQYFFTDSSNKILIHRRTSGLFQFRLRSAAPATLWEIDTTASYTTASNPGWHHMLIAAELDGTPVGQIYIDDSAAPFTVAEALATGSIDWTETDYFVGSTQVPGSRLNGDFAEVYITDEYLDISIEANRRKFVTGGIKPVDLGGDGSDPTGTAPLIFMSGDTDTWHTNKGSGGGFTENGALTDAASSP